MIPLHLICRLLGKPRLIPPFFLHVVGHIAGLRVQVRGQPEKNALLLANHVSWLDILALAGAARSAFVAHDGLAGQKLLKWLCEQNETIFIARHHRSTLTEQTGAIRQALGKRPLTIFPEGTTSDGTGILPFKSALLAAIDPLKSQTTRVQPVALLYEEATDIAWVGEGATNVRMVLSRRKSVHLTIHFLPPLEGPDCADRKSMAAAAQRAIAQSLTS
ncbi:lysophospholipid acyltransferase family protein [Altericroceibacterium spongiae]|nr:lysophospholipid acyltransferase family protein [Altericroceibacterium spongiae]